MKMDEQQIKEKYYQFMEIDILEFIKNWEDFISPYICEKSFFKQMDDYIKKLSLEEQKQYKEKRNLIKIHKNYYAQVVYQYLQGDKEDFSPFRYLNKDYLQVSLTKYSKIFPKYKERIQYVQQHIYQNKELSFLEELQLCFNNSNARYIKVLVPLLCCNKEDAIQILRGYRFSKNIFDTYLKCFQTRFPNHPQNVEYLESLYEEYSKTVASFQKRTQNFKNCYDEIFQNIYDSGISIEEYCFFYGGSINKISRIIKFRKNSQEVIEILSRDTKFFLEKVKDVVSQIILDEIDYLDYYKITKLDFNSLLTTVRTLKLDKENYKKVFQFINKGKMIESNNSINESAQLEKLTTFGNREITREEKIKIFNFLKENEIPLCYYNFALTKYVKGELNFGKQLEKKANL